MVYRLAMKSCIAGLVFAGCWAWPWHAVCATCTADFAACIASIRTEARTQTPALTADAYRLLLRETPLNVVTALPTLYAEALGDMAQQYAALLLWHDAASWFAAAYCLSSNKTYFAHMHWCYAHAAHTMGNTSQMSAAADAARRADPLVHPELYHFLAVREYALDKLHKARALWLEGLMMFATSENPDALIGYLDDAVPYWKFFGDAELQSLYDALQMVLMAQDCDSMAPTTWQRIMQERIKLEQLYPWLRNQQKWTALLPRVPNQEKAIGQRNADECCGMSNVAAVMGAVAGLPNNLRIHQAMSREAGGDVAGAIADYKSFVWHATNLWNNLVDGCPARCVAQTRLARLAFRQKPWPSNLLMWTTNAMSSYLSGPLAGGGQYYLMQLLLMKGVFENALGDSLASRRSLTWAQQLDPQSYKPRWCLVYNDLWQTLRRNDLTSAKQFCIELFDIEHARPTVQGFKLRETILALESAPTNSAQLVASESDLLPFWLDALHTIVLDMTPRPDCPDAVRVRGLRDVPFVSQVQATLLDGANVDRAPLQRYYDWLDRVGIAVPARSEHATLLREIQRERSRMAALLNNTNVTAVNITLHTYGDAVPAALYLVCNAPPFSLPLERGVSNDWTSRLHLPVGSVSFRYAFSADAGARLDHLDPLDVDGCLLPSDPATALLLNTKRSFWRTLQVTFSCTLPPRAAAPQLYISGSVSCLGSFTRNVVMLYNDGTHGDLAPRDRRWTRSFTITNPPSRIRYMYTAGAAETPWSGSEATRPFRRELSLSDCATNVIAVNDIYGIYLE